MISRRHPHLRLSLLALAIVVAAPSAFAQDSTSSGGDEASDLPTLESIIVTAQKREQQAQDVPIAISPVSGEFLDKNNITTFEDIGGYVPGLQTQVQSANTPGFVIRGITSDSGESNQQPRVSVFQDGVSISRSQGAVVELFDMERVEVLRGPQGTLFGRGAEIGAVHLIQNKAVNETSGMARIGFGNEGNRRAEAVYNTPLSENVFGRIAVFHDQHDGTVDNLSGGDLNGRDTTAFRASLHANVGDQSALDFILNYQKDTPPGTAFRSGLIPTRAGTTDLFDSPADLNGGTNLGLDRKVWGATLLGEFPLSDTWTLNTITGYRRFDSLENFDADGSQADILNFSEDAEGRQFSQEFRFNYDDGGSFRGFMGASWFDEDASQRVPFATDERSLYALLSPTLNYQCQTLLAPSQGVPTEAIPGFCNAILPVVPLLNADGTPNTANVPPALPNLGIPGVPDFIGLSPHHTEEYSNFGRNKALELFADGTWSLTDNFDLTAGIRLTREKSEAGYQALFNGTISALGQVLPEFPYDLAFPNALFAPTPRTNASETFNSVVGRLVGSYRFSDDEHLYASFSRGRRPNVVQVDGNGVDIVDAEIVNSYEIGLKGGANNGRFLYDLAVFHYDYSDFQTQVESPTPPPFFVTANGGNARASGLELSFSNRFSDHLSGFFNYSYINAKFDDTDGNGNPQALAGNRFRLTPKNSASLGLDAEFPVGDNNTFYLRPSYTWRSQVYFEDDNQPGIEQGAYGLLNLSAGIRFGEQWDLQVWGRNLNDSKYLIDAGNTGLLFGIPTYVPGQPRMYGVTATYRF